MDDAGVASRVENSSIVNSAVPIRHGGLTPTSLNRRRRSARDESTLRRVKTRPSLSSFRSAKMGGS